MYLGDDFQEEVRLYKILNARFYDLCCRMCEEFSALNNRSIASIRRLLHEGGENISATAFYPAFRQVHSEYIYILIFQCWYVPLTWCFPLHTVLWALWHGTWTFSGSVSAFCLALKWAPIEWNSTVCRWIRIAVNSNRVEQYCLLMNTYCRSVTGQTPCI